MSSTESPSLLPPSVVARLLAKIDIRGPDECWPWTASCHVRTGHGRLVVGGRAGRVEYAHRLAYMHWVGPIPEGRVVRHTCDNPPCCNPAHLLLGAPIDNVLDMMRRGWHGRQKLSADDVREIRSRPGDRASREATAAEFGISETYVRDLRYGKRARPDVH